jgi:predicted enzyme related to lactoylglutathione lyase
VGVTGIGGILFKAHDPVALNAWYAAHLGVNDTHVDHEPWIQQQGPTVFAVFPNDSELFGDSQSFILNFRVDGLDDFVRQLEADGVTIVKGVETHEGIGRFASIEDPEGNRVELWEPEEDDDTAE